MSGVAALIVAAGAGTRFGGDLPKVFVDLAGAPMFLWSLRAHDSCEQINRLVVAVGKEHLDLAERLVRGAGLCKPVSVVAGGDRRQDTVVAGLDSLASAPPDIIAIHDGARPLIERETILRSIELARDFGACVTATPVSDTIKEASESLTVLSTPDRRTLWRAQTPQSFRFELLRDCYERALGEGWEVTDDASVVERCGHKVRINHGPATNLKVTTRDDLLHARHLAARMRADEAGEGSGDERAAGGSFRIGHGYDVHALVSGRRLVLGGVEIPHETGLAGHSDADVVLHAACDAILGGAAAGDIGQLFPDTDPQFEGADSSVFCGKVAEHVRLLGYDIGNLDVTVVAQRPRLAPHIPQMRERIAAALAVDVSQVSVKATTTEGLGFEGCQEGISAHAVALLTRAL